MLKVIQPGAHVSAAQSPAPNYAQCSSAGPPARALAPALPPQCPLQVSWVLSSSAAVPGTDEWTARESSVESSSQLHTSALDTHPPPQPMCDSQLQLRISEGLGHDGGHSGSFQMRRNMFLFLGNEISAHILKPGLLRRRQKRTFSLPAPRHGFCTARG